MADILSKKIEGLTPLQRSFLVIENLQSKLNTLESSQREPIAIIGMGCRFPGGVDNPEVLWRILHDGIDTITEVPKNRWDIDAYYDPNPDAIGKMYTRKGAFVNEVDSFDADFFNISPREALSLDPQQRLLLEVSWQALENAYQVPEQLYKSPAGVFIGICSKDYAIKFSATEKLNAYFGTGNASSAAAGRLSYFLGLTGPSLAVDTACSSSLVAVHLACQSLRKKECNLALAGGVNLLLSPENSIVFSKARMLSGDGRCKTFDSTADGYVRGEGCGIIVLKRLSDAVKNQDNILAVIRGSAINQDGPSGGLTVPNGPSQEKVIRQALENGGVEPSLVSYIEAHGTGTSLGDPIEVEAIGAIFGENHSQENPLMIGSLKTNIGHLEGAAGIAGLMKVILQLQHQEIFPHLHFKDPNPYINWNKLPISVPTQATPWLVDSQKRIGGVSSFGFSGTNAHVILEEAPIQQLQTNDSYLGERPCHILTLSAQTEKALDDLVVAYQNYLVTHADLAIGDICFTANTGRSHFKHRLAITSSNTEELTDKLTKITAGKEVSNVFSGHPSQQQKSPKIAFLCSGQGSQYLNMGRQLYETSPVFREAIDQCSEILSSELAEHLLSVLYPETSEQSSSSLLKQTAYTQSALFAVEYALFKLWQSWGIEPDVVMGHSVGEYVAATIAGVFSLEDGLKLIAHRGRLMQELPEGGEMVAVMASVEQVNPLIAPYKDELAIAAINGPQNIVISGSSEAIAQVCETLQAQKIKTTQLQVSHAFHSPLMEPMLDKFAVVAEQITYHQPRIPLISNVTGSKADERISTPSYWVDHVHLPVKFANSMGTLQEEGYEIFLEIGPQPVLLGMGRQCWSNDSVLWLPSLRSGQEDWQQMLLSLAQLYVEGVGIDWSGFERDYPRKKVALPTYPFQRQRYWIDSSEDKSQKSQFSSSENKIANIVKALKQGNSQQWAQQLEKVGKFSSEQINLLPEMLDILVQQDQEESTSTTTQDCLYQVQWKNLLSPSTNALESISQFQPSHCLIFADSRGVGQALGTSLQKQGHQCSLVYPGNAYQVLEDGHYSLNPSQPENFQLLFQEVVSTHKLPLSKIIHLWSLDAIDSDDLTLDALEQFQKWSCGSLLHLLQALVDEKWSNLPRLWVVTRGTQAVTSATNSLAVTQATVWGIGKVAALEYPQIWGGLVDLDPSGSKDEAEILLTQIWENEGENQLALREGQFYVPRLVQQTLAESNQFVFHNDRSYLITGGLGALGLQVARWMIKQGVKYLVLTGRREISKQDRELIQQLEKQGSQVLFLQGDVSKLEDVAYILEEVKSSLPPIGGIIHTAGVLDDVIIQQMSWERFTKVIAPKVYGAWNLHILTQNLPLDFFVCFSSVASLLGSPGQGNYCAGNAFMDALAHYRQKMGLPGLTINWGPWAEAGMAVNLDSRYQKRIKAMGITPLTNQDGLKILEKLLGESSPQVGVLPVEWSVFQERFSSAEQIPLIAELIEASKPLADKPAKPQEDIFSTLLQMSSAQRQEYLTNYLTEAIAGVLHINPEKIHPTDSLLDLGMDSLMVMEAIDRLKQDLQLILYPREFYERPKIHSLAKYLVAEFELTHLKTTSGDQEKSSLSSSFPVSFSSTSGAESVTIRKGKKLPPTAFILSSPRSGSTLLRVMLAGHSALFSPPELHLLPFNSMGERQQQLGISHLAEGLQRALMELKGIDPATSQELVEQLIADDASIHEVYAMLQDLADGRLLVDKSPTYGMDRGTLERAEELFENAKYIHLIRHPYAVIESFARMRMDKLIGAAQAEPYEVAESIWSNSNQNIRDFCAQIDKERHYLLHYEDLVSKPEQVMKNLCEFLAIPFEPVLLQPYQGTRMTDGVYSKSMSLGDPNFLKHKQIDAKLAETWKEIKLPQKLGTFTSQLATSLGYQLPQESQTQKSRPKMQEHFLDIRGLNLCLCSWGPEAGPLVLCLHGILEQGAAWSEVAMRLVEKGYRVVAPDLRGHGRSDHAAKGSSYNLLDFLGDIDAIVDKLTDKAFTLVGHSLGSVIAALFASVRPQKVKNLVLVETILPGEVNSDEATEQIATHLDYLASPPKHSVFPDVATAAERLYQATPALSKSLAMKLAKRITEPCKGGVRWRWASSLLTRAAINLNGISKSKYLGILKQIKVPITLVYGDKSNFNREEDLSQQQAVMPQARRIIVSGGHNLHLEAASALAQFINHE